MIDRLGLCEACTTVSVSCGCKHASEAAMQLDSNTCYACCRPPLHQAMSTQVIVDDTVFSICLFASNQTKVAFSSTTAPLSAPINASPYKAWLDNLDELQIVQRMLEQFMRMYSSTKRLMWCLCSDHLHHAHLVWLHCIRNWQRAREPGACV